MHIFKRLLSIIFSLTIVFEAAMPGIAAFAENEAVTEAAAAGEDTETAADENAIYISTPADLVQLARNCRLDTWSAGKTVILKNDIDMSGKKDFKYIPVFGGTFDGQSFTIKGISFTENGSNAGLFRIIQPGATVKHLNLELNITPSGTRENIGGLAGKNGGTILNCSVRGTVRGKTYVGGITGINLADGKIVNSQNHASVYGEHYVGGIAGQNLGQIIQCTNSAVVNNTAVDVKLDIKSLNLTKLISTENFADITDVGGITGYSGGIIQSCTNDGEIGYTHLGYNIGGIAGRQAGYINGCTNNGKVCGRKDVGGIVGQMEPYTTLQYSPGSLDSLSQQLDTLQGLLDKSLNDANISRLDISNRLSSARANTDTARDAVKKMTDEAQNYLNNTADSINDTTARLSETANTVMPQLQSIGSATDKISKLADEYSSALDLIEKGFDGIDTDNMRKALDSLTSAMDDLAAGSKELSRAISRITNSFGDAHTLQNAIDDTVKSIQLIEGSIDSINKSLDNIKTSADEIIDSIKNGSFNGKDDLVRFFKVVSDSASQIKNTLPEIKTNLSALKTNVDRLKACLSDIEIANLITGIRRLGTAMSQISSGLAGLRDAANTLSSSFDELADAFDSVRDGAKEARKTTDKIKDELDGIVSSANSVVDALDDFVQRPTLTMDKVSDEFVRNKDRLSDSVSEISDAVFDVKDMLDSLGTTLNSDFHAVSNQMFNVFDCFTDAVDEAKDKSTDPSDYVEDISDTDYAGRTEGVVIHCINNGNVSGDLNTGGISGSMAIEYDFDPEDDVTKNGSKSLNFIYTTKAVLRQCTNYGAVEAKKNYAGGVVGKADLGSIFGGIGCGDISSKSGNYVGGVAGYSKSSIRNSYAKAALSGENYVGGIAGFGHNIYASHAIPFINESLEYTGSIAGDADGNVTGCYYAESNFGGIDDISYSSRAEELSYEDLIALDGTPQEFLTMRLRFYIDDKLTDTVEVGYGVSLTEAQIPKLPERENCFGKWDIDSFENITRDYSINAVYTDYITSIEGKQQRENGLAVFVAEGLFTDKSALEDTLVNPGSDSFPKGNSVLECHKFAVSGNHSPKTIVHYQLPADVKKLSVRTLNDGKWKTQKYKTDGKYITFEIDGNSASICIRKAAPSSGVIAICVIGIAVVLAAVFAALKLSRKHHAQVK